MQIGNISPVPVLDAASSASTAANAPGSGSAKAASGVESVAASSSASSATISSHTSTAQASHTSHATPASQNQAATGDLDAALAAVYTTSIAGHNYLGTVQQTAGEFIASAADPPAPPITGVGSSIQTAESNLTLVIDERV